MTQTASNNLTVWLEDGERVYPCPCGETHRGEYAAERYMQHYCLHDEVVCFSECDIGYCIQCGKPIKVTT